MHVRVWPWRTESLSYVVLREVITSPKPALRTTKRVDRTSQLHLPKDIGPRGGFVFEMAQLPPLADAE